MAGGYWTILEGEFFRRGAGVTFSPPGGWGGGQGQLSAGNWECATLLGWAGEASQTGGLRGPNFFEKVLDKGNWLA